MEPYRELSFSPGHQQVYFRLDPDDIKNLSTPLTIIPSPGNNKFIGVDRIIWMLKFNGEPYDYHNTGEIYFMIGDERVSTLQADNLNANYNNGSFSTANLCKDFKCPRINFDAGLTLSLSQPPPTSGDSTVYIQVYYYENELDFW